MTESTPRILFVGTTIPDAARPMTVAAAQTVEAALEHAHAGDADVLLFDISGVDGLGVFAIAKLADGAPEIPIALWAPKNREANALALLPQGARDVAVAEDCSTEDLAALLEGVAVHHTAERRLAARSAVLGVERVAADSWLWEADEQLRFTWFSSGFAKATGITPAAALGRSPWELDVLDQSTEGWERCRDDLSERRALRNLLCSLRDDHGRLRAFRISGDPRPARGDTPAGYAGTGLDATREVEHSDRLAKVHEHLMDTNETLETFRQRMEADLAAARNMQRELLPSPEQVARIEERYGVTIEAMFETSDELGGDIWGAHPIDDHRFAVYVADFSGHGVTAALNTFRLHAVIEHMIHGRENPGGYLQAINQRLAGLLPTGQYATMLYGVVDVTNDLLVYTAAASPPPLLTGGERDVRVGDGSGLPLGVTASASYETRVLPLASGELLFLYSDALTECGRENGRDLGKQGVQDLLGDSVARGGADVPLSAILGPFFSRVERPLTDDLTVVRCLRKPRS